jgi:ABC-type transporter Mla subunit MlaD
MSNLANLRETLERLDSALEDYILNGEADTTAERHYCRQALQLLDAVEKEQALLWKTIHDISALQDVLASVSDDIDKAVEVAYKAAQRPEDKQ